MKLDKNSLLNMYKNLSLQKGKLLSGTEFTKICLNNSNSSFNRHFKNASGLKEAALMHYPELGVLAYPVAVTEDQVIGNRLKLLSSQDKKDNQSLIEKISTLDYIEKFAEKVFSGRVEAKPYKSSKPTKRVLNLVLSDTHFGADIDAEETGGPEFGRIEEARRLAQVISETCNYKLQHRAETELNLILLGDIFQGMLGHDPRDGAQLSEQFCRSLHLLVQAISILSSNFKKVSVYCNTGNHGRNSMRHPNRAIHGKYDSFETMLYYSLQKSCSSLKNVSFTIPKTPYVIVPAFQHKIFSWHGDTGIKTGYVGKAINITNIEKSINQVNASLKDNEEFSVFVCGHLHLGTVSFLPNGATLLVNGGLPPVDPFCVSLGLHESNCGQMLFESTPDFAVGDIRFIRVDHVTDQNTKLDSVIQPWVSFNV